jgi:tetratricopeptide (TPR) repeat protein
MKHYALYALVGFILATPLLVAQTNATSTAPIPEEARRHFVMGTTLFKDAKTPDDYAQVESQFKQAVDLAPQWPDARYNLALSKEAAGDYSGAMADLKLYQQFKLSDTEARTVQDKIYALEARQQKATDEANSPAAKLKRFIKSLDGAVWHLALNNGYEDIECSGNTLTKTGFSTQEGRMNMWKISVDGTSFEVPRPLPSGWRETGSISTDGKTITLTQFRPDGSIYDPRVYVRK